MKSEVKGTATSKRLGNTALVAGVSISSQSAHDICLYQL